MSLLDKQSVQDICGHTALRARKWSGLHVNESQKIRHCRARCTEERRRRKKENAKSRFFYFARCVYSDVIYSFYWKAVVEHDSGV